MAFDPGGFSSEFGPGTAPPLTLEGATGTGVVVLQNTPTLITPEIGAATGHALALTGYGALPGVTYLYANGTPAAPTPITSGGWAGYSGYYGWDGAQFTYLGDFACEAVGVVGPNNLGSAFVFRTRPTGAGTVPAVAFTINPDQTVSFTKPISPTALPNPAAAALGGVMSFAPVAHQFLTGITTVGQPLAAQPAAADLSNGVTGTGAVVLANAPTFTANPTWPSDPANRFWASPDGAVGAPAFRKIVSGDLPLPAAAALGGVMSIAPVANQFLTGISAASGAPSQAPVSTQSLSDRVASTAFTPTVSVTTLGDGVFSGVVANGSYARLGMLVWFTLKVTFTLTYTTSTGSLAILGLPGSVAGLNYVQYVVDPVPGSPAGFLLGTLSGANLLGLIYNSAYRGNFFGPGIYGLVSGTQYSITAGGVYLGGG